VESAVGQRHLDTAAACVSAGFLAALQTSLATLGAAHQHRVLAFIDLDGARLVDAALDGVGDCAVVQLDVSGEDCVVDDTSGAVVSGSPAQRHWSECWTLARSSVGQPWLVEAVAGPDSAATPA